MGVCVHYIIEWVLIQQLSTVVCVCWLWASLQGLETDVNVMWLVNFWWTKMRNWSLFHQVCCLLHLFDCAEYNWPLNWIIPSCTCTTLIHLLYRFDSSSLHVRLRSRHNRGLQMLVVQVLNTWAALFPACESLSWWVIPAWAGRCCLSEQGHFLMSHFNVHLNKERLPSCINKLTQLDMITKCGICF